MKDIPEFNKYFMKEGMEGLLPQNLPDSILNEMLIESEAYEDDEGITGMLIAAVMCIKCGLLSSDYIGDLELYFKSLDDLFDKLHMYRVHIMLESRRREKGFNVPKKDLPTLDNIFNEHINFRITL